MVTVQYDIGHVNADQLVPGHFSLMRPARTWARSYCARGTSQLSALPSKTFDSRMAISGESGEAENHEKPSHRSGFSMDRRVR